MPPKTVSLRSFPTRCPTCGAPQPPDPLPPKGADLRLDAYRALRARLARAGGVPPWRVFPNATVRALADVCPASARDLDAVPGIGPSRRAEYGRALVALGKRLRAGGER